MHGSRITTSCMTFLPPFPRGEGGPFSERFAVRRIHAPCSVCRENVFGVDSGLLHFFWIRGEVR